MLRKCGRIYKRAGKYRLRYIWADVFPEDIDIVQKTCDRHGIMVWMLQTNIGTIKHGRELLTARTPKRSLLYV